jgi:hypothetical protein
MRHYFFDVSAPSSIEHGYKGRYLPSFEQTQQLAELIAMDLGCTRPDGSVTMEVHRNAPSLGTGPAGNPLPRSLLVQVSIATGQGIFIDPDLGITAATTQTSEILELR